MWSDARRARTAVLRERWLIVTNAAEHPAERCVIKVGGSLLDLPDLPARLRALRSPQQGPAAWLCGGGGAADAVRQWHGRFGIDEAAAHRLAMRSLSVSSLLLQELLPRSRLCETPAAVLAAWTETCPAVIDPDAWFSRSPGWFAPSSARFSGLLLPCSWDVTSDTLAACVAIELDADLCLLKSTDLPEDATPGAAVAAGAVDRAFERIAPLVRRITWHNLRGGRETVVAHR
jgi:aspartokinase-like uncharacterized kinase